jgi:hypothetical protein
MLTGDLGRRIAANPRDDGPHRADDAIRRTYSVAQSQFSRLVCGLKDQGFGASETAKRLNIGHASVYRVLAS